MTTKRGPRDSEAGFTLTELLVTIVILGIIGTLLPEAIILGLRFTGGTEKRIAATSALGTLNRYFYGDVQSAEQVTTDAACGVAAPIVHLSWPGADVVYTFDQPTGALDRVKCTDAGVVTTVLGRFDSATNPVALTCDACTTEVTLTVQGDPPTILTAVRRSSAS